MININDDIFFLISGLKVSTAPSTSSPGLEPHKLQLLMGHSIIETTKKYAQLDRTLLEAELAAADEALNLIIKTEDMKLHIERSHLKHADELEFLAFKK